MLKTLAVSTLLLGSTIAFAQPAAARDRDDHRDNRDRDHYARNYDRRDDHDRDRDRGDWRGPVRYGTRYGYGDLRYGHYDRFGVWCWY
jgi:hypothetical protein